MSFKNLENPKKKIYCHSCERDISRHTYFACEECGDIEFCPICFGEGRETLRHRRSHNYRIYPRLDFTILEENWTALDELLLLEGIETYGYGNSEDIKSHIGGKTKEDVERHFHDFYLGHFKSQKGTESIFAHLINQKPEAKEPSRGLLNLSEGPKITRGQFKALLERRLEVLQPVISRARETAQQTGISQSDKGSLYGEILGYMPLREEFDVEYDNDAELFLADMEFAPDDTEEETKMKYCILEIYNRRLIEREKRKRFVIEHGLLNLKEQLEREKAMSEEEREIRSFLKPFMRFQSREEHEELVSCLLKDLEIKRTFEQLLAAQNVGCENLAELENLVFSNEGALKMERRLLEFNEKRQVQKQKGAELPERRSLRGKGLSGLELGEPGQFVGESTARQEDDDLNLCFGENELCNKLKIGFNDYLLVKEYLVRECISKGFVDRKDCQQNIKVEQKQFNMIFDFLVEKSIILAKNH